VPIRFSGPEQVIDTFVVLENADQDYYLHYGAVFHTVEIDPDFHLFRRLYPEEIEPIISAVMGAPKKRFVAYDAPDAVKGLFQSFSASISEDSVTVESPDILDSETKDFAPVLLNPIELPGNLFETLTATDSSVTINGTSYPRAGHTFVLSGRGWNGFGSYLVVLTSAPESLPRLGQLVPHYGKYSYLVFEGAQNVGKGQWPTVGSPLKKEF